MYVLNHSYMFSFLGMDYAIGLHAFGPYDGLRIVRKCNFYYHVINERGNESL